MKGRSLLFRRVNTPHVGRCDAIIGSTSFSAPEPRAEPGLLNEGERIVPDEAIAGFLGVRLSTVLGEWFIEKPAEAQ